MAGYGIPGLHSLHWPCAAIASLFSGTKFWFHHDFLFLSLVGWALSSSVVRPDIELSRGRGER